jgi:Transcription factor zinc-finger
VADEKDRFGDKIKDLEKAREDQWAAQRDRELLENLRRKQAELKNAMSAATETMGALCPRCHHQLVKGEQGGVSVLSCPDNDGAWLDQAELNRLLQRLK